MRPSTTNPATGEAFLNRTKEMSHLERVLLGVKERRPRWLAIVGPRKIGKTSLLMEWIRRSDTGVRWATFDLFREPPSASFLRRYAIRVTDAAFSLEIGASLENAAIDHSRWRTLLLGAESFRGLSVENQSWLLGVPSSTVNEDWVRMALELPETLARVTHVPMIVVIDEFQELLGQRDLFGEEDPAMRLRGTWQHQQDVTYVISGSAQHTMERLVSHHESAFFHHFDLLRLGPLPEVDALELLTRVARRPFSPEAQKAAWSLFGGHPHLLGALGDALLGPEKEEVDLSELKSAIQDIFFSSNGRISLHYESMWDELVGRATATGAVVQALASGPLRLTDIATQTEQASGAVASTLRRLGEAAVKDKEGLYALADPVFARWLQWRGPGGVTVPMRILGDQAEIAVAEGLATRGFATVYQSRGSRGSFDLLAIRDGRILGIQVKRSPLPLRLKKSELERIEADAERLKVPWVLAAVEPSGRTLFLDPARRASLAFESNAAITNLPLWFDERFKPEDERGW